MTRLTTVLTALENFEEVVSRCCGLYGTCVTQSISQAADSTLSPIPLFVV